MGEYSDSHRNYLRLQETIQEIQQNDFKPSIEWYNTHYRHIVQYSSIMDEFMASHTDTPEILQKLMKVNYILSILQEQFRATGFFDYRAYLTVNQVFHVIINQLWKEEELLELLSKMEI